MGVLFLDTLETFKKPNFPQSFATQIMYVRPEQEDKT